MKTFEVPIIWEAALQYLSYDLCRVMQNKTQKEYQSPFSNTGNKFKCDAFEVEAYSWGDDEQPFNFKWRDVEISWYKWCGRGMSSNVELTPQLAQEMLVDCLKCLQIIDNENEE